MTSLPHNLYTAAQIREFDRCAIEDVGIPAIALMERAGRAAFDLLQERWPEAGRILVVCGGGNNGGDGYVVARLAHAQRLSVKAVHIGDRDQISGTALVALQEMQSAGLSLGALQADTCQEYDLIVDALLGTGLSGEVRTEFRDAIVAMNACNKPILSLDIPSGLSADTGAVLGEAVHADATITYIRLKQGLFTAEAPCHVGSLYFDTLGLEDEILEKTTPAAQRLTYQDLSGLLTPRTCTAHKGQCGHVLVVGGAPGYSGAIRLCGEAALRTGSGLVSIASHPQTSIGLNTGRPELMCHGTSSSLEIEVLLTKVNVVAIGPGLGQDSWGRELWERVLSTNLPLVVDADALNLLAANPVRRDNWVLTPHPGEAARLLNTSVEAIQKDRFAAAVELYQRFGGAVVLKGHGSIIVDANGTGICDEGNPGMASGGMGDLLTGVIASLLAQGLPSPEATRLGVALHSWAGDHAAAEEGERGLLASDLLTYLRAGANPEILHV